MKNEQLNQWFWKWHVIAGLISLPFVLTLAITGGIYLFKDEVEKPVIKSIQHITETGTSISFEQQLQLATNALGKMPTSVIIPSNKNEATEFVSGKFSHKKSIFINPYSKKITGNFSPKDTWMYTIRKLHGELLGGSIGTKIIELVASWMVILILTGVYIFWPDRERGWKGFFSIRTKLGTRILFRDLHSVGGFWISLLLLLTLAGGFPWTDVFGGNFKKLQELTNTGFPKEWFGIGITSQVQKEPLSLDKILAIAKKQSLPGKLTIDFPKHKAGVFSVSNSNFPLDSQQKIHFDQYSGNKLMTLHWSDVGVLMRGRMWVMAFHQGQFGTWNFYTMLLIAILLTLISAAGLFSYLLRKQKGSWNIPKTPSNFKIGYGIVTITTLLGLVFPLFGISLIAIGTYSLFKKNHNKEN